MDSPVEIIVVGSHAPGLFMRVSHVPKEGETVLGWDYQEPMDGGKGSNQAIAAAVLGASVAFVGCVGRDRIGDTGEQWMRRAGVDTRFLRRSESTASGVGFILLGPNGVPAMITTLGANAELSLVDVDNALAHLGEARVLLTQFEINPSIAMHAAELGRRSNLISIVNPAPAATHLELDFSSVDVLVPNEIEALQLMRMDPASDCEPAELAWKLRAKSRARNIIVTLGRRGIVGADEAGTWRMEARSAEIVDTSGAGDSLCAALAVGLARGLRLREASEWACQVAALSVAKPGTIPAFPTAEEVDQAGIPCPGFPLQRDVLNPAGPAKRS